VKYEEFEKLFEKYGTIYSSKINRTDKLAYLQFLEEKSINSCINAFKDKPADFKLDDQQLELNEISKGTSSRPNDNNLFAL